MTFEITPVGGWNHLIQASRLILTQDRAAPVLIWGHDDPDGITATAILLKSIGRIFQRA